MRRLAGHYLKNERTGHTLQPTALVPEAFLKPIGQDRTDWQNRAQFMGVADGKSVVYTVSRPREEIWILDGIERPKPWWARVLGWGDRCGSTGIPVVPSGS